MLLCNRRTPLHFALTLMLICVSGLTQAAPDCPTPAPVLDASVASERSQLLNYVCYFSASPDAPGGRIRIPANLPASTQWLAANGQDLVFVHSARIYWIRLAIKNDSSRPGLWYLKIPYPPLDYVDFWLGHEQDPAIITTGDQRLFSARRIDYRYYLLPVTLGAGESTRVTLRVQSSGALNIPLSLESTDSVIADSNSLTMTHGLFYGSVAIFSLFNLLLFFSSGTAYYFYNAFYMLSTALFLSAMGGFAFQYFWPDDPWFANAAVPMTEALSSLSMTLFARSFLEIGSEHRRSSRLLIALAAVSIVLLGLVFVLPYTRMIIINTLFGLFTIVCLFALGVMRVRQGYGPAKWYVLSWSLMVTGTSIYTLAAFGYLADFLAREIMMQVAVGAQVVLLNYAIIQRWRLLNTKLLEAEHSARHGLEIKVQARTAELRDTMRELERANRKLAELSTRDSLTGLYNRRYLDATLPDICAAARRQRHSVAMILIDADHFKRINDTWGHEFGDSCLVQISEILSRHARRPRDVVCRFGGEEFALVLPDTDIDGASRVCSHILSDMAGQRIPTPDDQTTRLTLSAGVAVLAPDEDETRLFTRADDALYRAKALGRNRAEVAPSDDISLT